MEMLFAFFGGVFTMLGFILYRMMSNDGWDDSNITNALRLLSHVTLHAEDFAKMYYLQETTNGQVGATYAQVGDSSILVLRRPFWYVDKDELSEVVSTRP